jgi:hypothetical protein
MVGVFFGTRCSKLKYPVVPGEPSRRRVLPPRSAKGREKKPPVLRLDEVDDDLEAEMANDDNWVLKSSVLDE